MRALPPLLLLAACAGAPACPTGTAPATVAELVFGRGASDGSTVVTESDWSDFLAAEATPRFPDGLTVIDARGQWRGADGRIVSEATKQLWLVLPGIPLEEAIHRTTPLTAAYRTRFGQESVLSVLRRSCVSF